MLTYEELDEVAEILEKSIRRSLREYREWGVESANVPALCRALEQHRKLREGEHEDYNSRR
jgi:hypothetical protein